MTIQSVTLSIPQTIYKEIQGAAEKRGCSVEDILLEALIAITPVLESGPSDLQAALAQMAYLNDAALWQAARAFMLEEQWMRLQALHDKQQQEGLTLAEQDEEQALLKLYWETHLVGEQAAALLRQRNYDVPDPTRFTR